MPVTRERFAQGLTGSQYLELVQQNRERFEANLAAADELITDEDRAFFSEQPLSILAIGEDWCTDVVQFLPPIIRLAEQCPNIELRIFPRDQNLDLMNQYLNQGKYQSIPVFVFFDGDWNELGHFIERPAAVTAEMAQETRRFAEANPQLEGINRAYEHMPDETRQRVRENSSAFRWNNMLRWNRIFLDEIRALVAAGRQAEAADD